MSELGLADASVTPMEPTTQREAAVDFAQAMATLREAGADRLDPVYFHYLQVLAQRAASHRASVRRILDRKLAQALAAFSERLAQAQHDAQNNTALPGVVPGPSCESLSDLSSRLARGRAQRPPADRADRLPVQYFRNTWSRLSTDKQVTQALNQAPKNAGPINSHGLVLRSLALMRDVSPDYLNRFVSYVETLLALDPHDGDKPARALTKRPAKTGKP